MINVAFKVTMTFRATQWASRGLPSRLRPGKGLLIFTSCKVPSGPHQVKSQAALWGVRSRKGKQTIASLATCTPALVLQVNHPPTSGSAFVIEATAKTDGKTRTDWLTPNFSRRGFYMMGREPRRVKKKTQTNS